MNRLPLFLAAGVAAAAAATPAIIGLAGNPSFSEQLPVRVPAHASVASFHDSPGSTGSAAAFERASRDDHGRGDGSSPRRVVLPALSPAAGPRSGSRASAARTSDDRELEGARSGHEDGRRDRNGRSREHGSDPRHESGTGRDGGRGGSRRGGDG